MSAKGKDKATDCQASAMVVLGIGGAPHGIKGELRIKTFTENPLAIGDYGPLSGSDGATYQITAVRPAKTVVVARLKGVDSREAAEALNGVEFSVSRSALGDDKLDDGEYFHADLIGLTATDEQGGRHGRVVAIHDFGGGDMLELSGGGRKNVFIPFTQAAVPSVDLAGRQITVDPLAAGLIEDDEQQQP